tara:strand:+ start:744 stop:986 length:243 start_codon:yes stop_codon:yes gene_type:complete
MTKESKILNKVDKLIDRIETLLEKQKTIPKEDNFISINQASRILNVSRYYLYKGIKNGKIKTTKINGKYKIFKKSLQDVF